jgi:hypothetical protein
MKAFYQITSIKTGTIVLKRRKVAKALRCWLRENGYPYKYTFFVSQDDSQALPIKKILQGK